MRLISIPWLRCFWFPKDRMTKSSMTKGKMAAAAQTMEFERAANTATSDSRRLERFGPSNGSWRKTVKSGRLCLVWIRAGCVFRFLVCQGKLIERTSISHKGSGWGLLTYVGQFYQEKSHLVPMRCYPAGYRLVSLRLCGHSKIFKPQRGREKQLVNLAIKNARVIWSRSSQSARKISRKAPKELLKSGTLAPNPGPSP